MMSPTIIEERLKEKYQPELQKLFSLAQSNEVPAICLAGEDNSLMYFVIRLFLSAYENKSYQDIANSNDYYEIESDSGSIKIDDIRKLIRFSTLKKERLRHKYTVIRTIENANIYAQNSLLKIIEEPGTDTLFICSSCAYATLLNTIRSRLFRINIPNKPLKEMEAYYCDEIRWLATLSFDVLSDFSQWSKNQQKELITSIRNKPLHEIMEDVIRSFGDGETSFDSGTFVKNRSLKRLYSLLFVEKCFTDILFNASQEVHPLILQFKAIIGKKSLYKNAPEKSTATSFNNAFFKELFIIAERFAYIFINLQEGHLL